MDLLYKQLTVLEANIFIETEAIGVVLVLIVSCLALGKRLFDSFKPLPTTSCIELMTEMPLMKRT